jgi:sarcosine oxidase subunit gamma
MPVSAPEVSRSAGARCGRCLADVVEIAARRENAAQVAAIADARGSTLPGVGRSFAAADRIAIGVRPERWLLLGPTSAAGASASAWESCMASHAAVVDLSSAWAALHLTGRSAREVLARGCRVDLDDNVFACGHVASTIVAQVVVIVVALSSGMLLLTPSTTARHFSEWLAQVAAPFGFEAQPARRLAAVLGDSSP